MNSFKNMFLNLNHINFYLFLTVIITALALLGLFKALSNLRKIKKNDEPTRAPSVITSEDIRAIAGEDVMATQLDLARAYMEIKKTSLAKQILSHVVENGDSGQKSQARELIAELES